MTLKIKYVNQYMMTLVENLKYEVMLNQFSPEYLFYSMFSYPQFANYKDLFAEFNDRHSQIALMNYIFNNMDTIKIGDNVVTTVIMPSYPFKD